MYTFDQICGTFASMQSYGHFVSSGGGHGPRDHSQHYRNDRGRVEVVGVAGDKAGSDHGEGFGSALV